MEYKSKDKFMGKEGEGESIVKLDSNIYKVIH